MSELFDKLFVILDALDRAGLPHAVGGAIALGYCIREPRGTRDLDINVFVEPQRGPEVLKALRPHLRATADQRKVLARDAQVRLMWDETPVDIFLAAHPLHHGVARSIREVPANGRTIPVLDCESLLIFKAMFNRGKDWADIEEMIRAGTVGRGALERLQDLLGPGDPAVVRLRAALDAQ